MLAHKTNKLTIFFTDKQKAFPKEAFYACPSSQELLQQKPFEFLKSHGATSLVVTDQTHGINGLIITSQEQAHNYTPYSCQADFMVTNVPHVALGVATADCLPIIFYDPVNHVIAATHAGWQGTVRGIAITTIEAMQANFGTQPADIQVFFGPSARVEAYEVGADFVKNIPACSFIDEVFVQRNGKHYFNVPLYNQRLLEIMGLTQFNSDYNCCTITNHNYCSYRREKEFSLRQLSIVVLNNLS